MPHGAEAWASTVCLSANLIQGCMKRAMACFCHDNDWGKATIATTNKKVLTSHSHTGSNRALDSTVFTFSNLIDSKNNQKTVSKSIA